MFIKHPLLWVGIVLAGLFMLAVYIGDGAQKLAPSGLQSGDKSKPAEQKKPAASKLESSSAALDAKKHPGEYEADYSKREDADLCAQRRMAKASEDQTGLNIVGLGLLFFTLCATIAAALYARQAARAAHRTVLVMQDTAERQLRAYITLSAGVVLPSKPSSGEAELVIRLRNGGATPAYRVRVWHRFKIGESDDEPFAEEGEFLSEGIVGPGDTIGINSVEPLDATGTERIKTTYDRFFAWGRVEYCDAFGRPHFFSFKTSATGEESLVLLDNERLDGWGLHPVPTGFNAD